MEAGETMVEIIRSTPVPSTLANNVTTASGDTHEGVKQYYIQKIEELQVKMNENFIFSYFGSDQFSFLFIFKFISS
jgi:hypothetical protein